MSDEIGLRGGATNIRDSLSIASEAANRDTPQIYEFGPFRLEPSERKLLRGNEIVALTPKAFDTLVLLVRNGGHLMEKDELLRRLWPDSFVEEGSLSNNIFMLRKALGEDPPFIETVPRRGYRFVGAVRQLPDAAPTRLEKPLVEGHREVANEVSMDLRPSSAVVKPRPLWPWAAALVAAMGLGAGILWFVRPALKIPEPRLTVTPLTASPDPEFGPTFSPDGNQVAFARHEKGQSESHICVKLIGTGGAPLRLTTGSAHDYSPAWSPDGRYIAFLRELSPEKFAVLLIPALGGPERKIAEVFQGASLTWGPDANSLVINDQDSPKEPAGLFLLAIDTGEKRGLTSPPSRTLGDFFPSLSPDGEHSRSAGLSMSGLICVC